MHTVPLINHPCIVCCNSTSMWCSRCQRAWYCCPEHLKADWARHRNECIPASNTNNCVATYGVNMIATPPPAEPQLITVSAIFFNPNEDRPRIISINCRPAHKTSHGTCPKPLLQDYFNENSLDNIILTQGLNGENLRFPLNVWYCPTSLKCGSPVNRAIRHITSGAASKSWYGSVVVLKFNGSRRSSYTDAGSNDLPALSAYFIAFK